MHFEFVSRVLLLLAVANSTPVLIKKLLGNGLSWPLDFGIAFPDGRPIFGPSKTIRGLAVAVLSTSMFAPLLGLPWSTGLAIGTAAMLGDLASSFTKRRMGLASSSMAPGLDQVPESLLPAILGMSVLGLSLADVGLVVLIFFAGEVVFSRLFYWLRIRDQPY